jgi:hypothetical protein
MLPQLAGASVVDSSTEVSLLLDSSVPLAIVGSLGSLGFVVLGSLGSVVLGFIVVLGSVPDDSLEPASSEPGELPPPHATRPRDPSRATQEIRFMPE